MGQGHSVQDVGVHRSKSRYSTRSLPDNSRISRRSSKHSSSSIKNSAAEGTATDCPVGNNLDLNDSKTASELWWKDAAPYYSAPAAKYRPGPRSLDVGYGVEKWGDSAPYHTAKAYSEIRSGRSGDAWSDVASDMYRLKEKKRSGSRRSSRKSKKTNSESMSGYDSVYSEGTGGRRRKHGGIPEDMETQSEVLLDASRERGSRWSLSSHSQQQKKPRMKCCPKRPRQHYRLALIRRRAFTTRPHDQRDWKTFRKRPPDHRKVERLCPLRRPPPFQENNGSIFRLWLGRLI